MKPREIRLECRAGNWVATEDGYSFRPATKTEGITGGYGLWRIRIDHETQAAQA